MTRIPFLLAGLLLCSVGAWHPAAARQAAGAGAGASTETNAEVLTRLALECTAGVLQGPDSLIVSSPSRLPFLGSGLLTSWQRAGKVLFVPGSREGLGRVDLGLERAGVSYRRATSGLVERRVALSLSVRRTTAAGQILEDDLCAATEQDLVPLDRIPDLEDAGYPETRADIPLSFWRRLVQPAVITAATAVGTILFFSLRSRRSTDG